MNKKIGILVLLFFSLMVFGCEFIYPESHVTPMSNTSLLVYDKCQIEHFIGNKMLEIKAGHFAFGIYEPESGKEETGLTANLWIMIQGSPETTLSVRVHKNQTVQFMDYDFQILRVEMDKIGGFVEFEVAMTE
jgi:hypothetical protein